MFLTSLGLVFASLSGFPAAPASTPTPLNLNRPVSASIATVGATSTALGLDDLTDEEVLEAFDALEERAQRGVVDYLRLDLKHADCFQLTVLRFILSQSDRDVGLWPAAPEIHWFDPVEFAPAQPIGRRVLDPDSSSARTMAKALKRGIPDRRLDPGFAYDWGTGDVVRLPNEEEPRRIVSNALHGFAPELDLAEALVLRWLDDGAQRAALGAFEHRYTDRNGNVFPDVSLYDAWASGAEIEMPDIDTLGLARTLLPSSKIRRRWVAPVPNTEHNRLYGAIGDLFVPAKEHRSLREALARCVLIAEPIMRDGFSSGHVTAFQAFWDVNASEPTRAAEALPDPEDFSDFLIDWTRKLGKDEELLNRARARTSTLARDQEYIRGRLIAVMRDVGAFDPPKAE